MASLSSYGRKKFDLRCTERQDSVWTTTEQELTGFSSRTRDKMGLLGIRLYWNKGYIGYKAIG